MGDGNRNNYVVGGLPYATVSLGPLLFALPLEGDKQWQYALDTRSSLSVTRNAMPASPWNWPLNSPLTVTVSAHGITWPDVWHLPSASLAPNTSVNLKLVPYGCTQVFRVSMFPYVDHASSLIV